MLNLDLSVSVVLKEVVVIITSSPGLHNSPGDTKMLVSPGFALAKSLEEYGALFSP